MVWQVLDCQMASQTLEPTSLRPRIKSVRITHHAIGQHLDNMERCKYVSCSCSAGLMGVGTLAVPLPIRVNIHVCSPYVGNAGTWAPLSWLSHDCVGL